MKSANCIALTVLLLLTANTALGTPNPNVQRRLDQLSELFVDKPSVPVGLFHEDFLKQVPATNVASISKEYFTRGGAIVDVKITERISDHIVTVIFTTKKGMTFPGRVGLSPKAPHAINTFWIGRLTPAITSVNDAVKMLRELGAGVSLTLAHLGGDKPKTVASLNPDRPLAIGSAFKLYVLGELIDNIQQGKYQWKTLGRIREHRKSWPSGILQDWPDDSLLTLQTLASLMISQSDNTATDMLLFILGRQNVERQLSQMGLAQPSLNQPFLSTKEMFLLKNRNQQETRVKDFLALDEAGRRNYLRDELSSIKRADIELEFTGVFAIDQVEWFASTSDMCRAMDWLKRHTSTSMGKPARDLLSINPGLSFDEAKWRYIGFKGGSEPGVLNLTWLLERADGKWFALSTTWNDTENELDKKSFYSIVQSLITFLGETTP